MPINQITDLKPSKRLRQIRPWPLLCPLSVTTLESHPINFSGLSLHLPSAPAACSSSLAVLQIFTVGRKPSCLGRLSRPRSLSAVVLLKVCPAPTHPSGPSFLPPDEVTIDILRGIQGCGAAATIPACVRPSHHVTTRAATHLPNPSLVFLRTPSLPRR